MVNVVPGTVLNRYGEYYDEFQVRDRKARCRGSISEGGPEDLIRTFMASSPEPGLLQIEEIVGERECANNGSDPDIGGLPGVAGDEDEDDVPEWRTMRKNVFGDPHLVTIDGLHYSLQAAGEFDLAASEDHDMEIQARFVPQFSYSVIDRVATLVNDYTIELTTSGMLLNGTPHSLAAGAVLNLDNNARVIRDTVDTKRYFVLWDGAHGPVLSWIGGSAPSASLYIPGGTNSDLRGLLGDGDGDPLNDLRLRDGTQLPADSSKTTLHGDYAESWRITDTTSLFTYAAGQNTSTFTDRNFPPNVVTIDDLTANQILLATDVCRAHDVPAGPQFNDCIVDVTLTSNNEFAAAASGVTDIAIDPAAITADASGAMSLDFESSTLPANVAPATVTTSTSATAFAGAFAGSGTYRFFAQSLPTHAGGTLTFDVLAIGDWTSDSDQELATVHINRQATWSGSFEQPNVTPTRTGQLNDGVPFSAYTVSIPLTHTDEQIEVIFGTTGVDGLANQAFGIDNISLDLNVLPTVVPGAVSIGGPTATVSTTASGQTAVVSFEAMAGQTVNLLWSNLSFNGGNTHYYLHSPDGSTLASRSYFAGSNFDWTGQTLPTTGTYKLLVDPTGPSTGSATVQIATSVVPGEVTAGGPAATVTTTAARQTATISFEAMAGQKINVLWSGLSFGGVNTYYFLRKPDGTTLKSSYTANSSITWEQQTLPVAGTYTLQVDPTGSATGSATAQVVPAEVSGTATIGGASVNLPVAEPGQTSVVSFEAMAGQKINVLWSGLSFGGVNTYYFLHKPDGTTLKSSYTANSSITWEQQTLPVAGTYTLLVDPTGSATGSATAQVVPAEIPAAATIGGAPVTTTTTASGQTILISFDAMAGQKINVLWSGLSFGGVNTYYFLRKPDGTTLKSSYTANSSITWEQQTLPVAGTYTLLVDPTGSATGSATATVTAAA